MNILITGGLLGVAFLAILGAVVLGIHEDRVEKAQQVGPNATALLPQQSQSRQRRIGELPPPVPVTPVLDHPSGQLGPLRENNEALHNLNGQVHEITNELRTLAQRASELEQRLSHLSALFEHYQSRQSGITNPFPAPEGDAQAL